jgi:F0F1-type ATP synthase assembly protein I
MSSVREELGSVFRSLSTASTIAMSVVFSTFAGVLAGYYLDTWLFERKTYPWLTIICFGFGLAGGIKNFLILSRRFAEEAEKAERRGQKNKTSPDKTRDVDSNV